MKGKLTGNQKELTDRKQGEITQFLHHAVFTIEWPWQFQRLQKMPKIQSLG